jgi:hypothetical protein
MASELGNPINETIGPWPHGRRLAFVYFFPFTDGATWSRLGFVLLLIRSVRLNDLRVKATNHNLIP